MHKIFIYLCHSLILEICRIFKVMCLNLVIVDVAVSCENLSKFYKTLNAKIKPRLQDSPTTK